jgi:hypothetical protein
MLIHQTYCALGNCWRALPLEEKKIWEIRAKQAKAEHKRLYPDYRFKPVHTKKKAAQAAAAAAALAVNVESSVASSSKAPQRKKATGPAAAAEEARCEAVAQLLLEGKKGAELAAAVRAMDAKARNAHIHVHRRSSSVPPMMYSNVSAGMNGIAMPSLPHLDLHIPVPDPSPASHDVTFISRLRAPATNEPIHVPRRPSSARPFFGQYEGAQAWDMHNQAFYFGQQDFLAQNPFSVTVGGGEDDALPEPDTSLFNPSFLSSSFGSASVGGSQVMYPAEALPPHAVDPFTAPSQIAAPSYNHQFSSVDPSMPASYTQVAQPQPTYNMPLDMSYNGFESNANVHSQESGLYDPFGFDQHGSNGATPSSSRLSTPQFALDGTSDLTGTSSWSGSPMASFTEMPGVSNTVAYSTAPNQTYVQYEQQQVQAPSSESQGNTSNINIVVSPTPVRSDDWAKALDSAVNGLSQPTSTLTGQAVSPHAPNATAPMHNNVKLDEMQYGLSMIGDENGLALGSYIPGLGLSRMSIDMGFRSRLSMDVAGTAATAEA